jgi:hypothetical protein
MLDSFIAGCGGGGFLKAGFWGSILVRGRRRRLGTFQDIGNVPVALKRVEARTRRLHGGERPRCSDGRHETQ